MSWQYDEEADPDDNYPYAIYPVRSVNLNSTKLYDKQFWKITHSGSTDEFVPPNADGFDTPNALTQKHRGEYLRFTTTSAGVISISFHDDPHEDNLATDIVWALREVVDEPKAPGDKLEIVVGEIDLDDANAVNANEAQADKGGISLPSNTYVPIRALVPDGFDQSNSQVTFSWNTLPAGVKVYDRDKTEISSAQPWPLSEGSKLFYLRADSGATFNIKFTFKDDDGEAVPDTGGAAVSVGPDYDSVKGKGCGCESDSCMGSNVGTNDCLRLQINLGKADFGDSAGYLLLLARRPNDSLVDPAYLQRFANDRLLVGDFDADDDEIVPNSDYGDENEDWGKAVLNLHVDGYGYDIDFYESDGGTLATSPYRTVTVENLNGATSNDELYITETIDLDASTTQKIRMWHFEWTGTGSGATDNGSWILTEGEAAGAAGLTGDTILRITERAEVWNGAGDEVTETVTIKESDNTVVSKTEEVWKDFEWGRELISKTMDPDTTAADKQLKETWTYYDNASTDGDNYGRLESYLSETGYWERYEYDADGNVAKTMRQHEDEVLNTTTAFATAAADNIVEAYTEDAAVSITGYTEDVRVEKWQIKVEGTVERTWYQVYIDETDSSISGCTEELSVRPVTKDPESGTTLAAVIEDVLDGTDTTSLVTKSWHWEDGATGIGDNEPYDARVMQSPDGQVTVYERTIATDEHTTVVKRGFSDDSLTDILAGTGGADIEYGTKTTSVTDARGNMVTTKNETISESDNSGAWFITSLMKADDTDEFGRPTVTEYFFGEDAADEAATPGTGTAAYDTRLTFGCCGGGEEEVRTGRDGVQTTTLEDVLGRTAYTKRWANTGAAMYSVSEYDAAGRVVASGLSTDDDLEDAADLKSSRTYDKAGRMDSATDEEGRKGYRTYRRVTTTGTAYTGTGVFYWETRAYGNDDDAPVSVAWRNSHGRTVLSYTGSGTWSGVPTGTETLTEHTRSTSVYDWDNRMTEGRAYFDIASLAKDAAGTAGINYLVTGKTEYDALGRGFRRTDAAGNITETVYEDGTGRAIKTLLGVDVADLHTVSRVYYNKFVGSAPTGDDRPWPTRVYTVKPGLTSAPDDSDLDDATPTFTDYTYTETVEEYDVVLAVGGEDDHMIARSMWSRPEHGPWSYSETDEQGRGVASYTTRNGNAAYLLTKSATSYYPDSAPPDGDEGKPQYTDQFTVSSGSVGTNKVRSTHSYDDAGRQVKTETTGRGFTKTEYDAYGRTERTVFASSEGSNTDADAFTDDIVLTESVPTYDKSGRVTGTVTYERAHDATATGLLSAAAASQSRANYSYIWFDDNGRQTHLANLGTDSSYTYVAGTPIEPDTLDTRLVSKVEYDDAGRAYLTTDNKGRKTKAFFDDLGRVEYTVENYKSGGTYWTTDPSAPKSRDADVNRITQTKYDNSATGGGARIELVAIDPDADGTTTDNQSTLYIHSGEVDAGERGPIPVNGRPIAILMPDAIEDGTTRANVITEIDAGGEVFGDFTFTSYYANGQVKQTTDPRGVQRNSFYTDEGWPDYTTVTEATGNTWDSVGDLRTAYTYGDAGERLTATTFDVATGGSSNETSKLTYIYDGFYNITEEKQDHDPTANSGAGDPKSIFWAYDTTVSSNIYTHAYRLDKITYPNGRVIHNTYDGHSGIDEAISRANAIADDSSGSPGDDIAAYSYLGSGRMVIKDLPTPDIKLDYFGGTSGTYDGLDAFGRITAQQWVDYSGTDFDVLHIKLGYDRNSNKLYDDRQVYKGSSKVFGHDELDRMTTFDQGQIKSDQSAIEDHWVTRTQHFGLDQLGNPLTVNEYINDTSADAFSEITSISKANEIESIKIMGERRKPAFVEDEFEADTSAAYEISSDDGDAFSINTTNGELTVTNTGTDGETILLVGEAVGMHTAYIYANFPNENGGEAGYVFGYTGPDDYYLVTIDAQNNRRRFYRVVNGSRTLIRNTNVSDFGTGTYIQFAAMVSGSIFHHGGINWLSEGIPAGRVGLYTSQADTEFHYLGVWS